MDSVVKKICEEKTKKVVKYMSPDGKSFSKRFECVEHIRQEKKKEVRKEMIKSISSWGIDFIATDIHFVNFATEGEKNLNFFYVSNNGTFYSREIGEFEHIGNDNVVSAGWYYIKNNDDIAKINEMYGVLFMCNDNIFEGRVDDIRGWVFVMAGSNYEDPIFSTYLTMKHLELTLEEKENEVRYLKETCGYLNARKA